MNDQKRGPIRIVLKTLAYAFVYAPLHFLYDWFPNALTAIPGGTGEAVFQHMKIGFWTWALVSFGEYLIVRRGRIPGRAFVASRAIGTMAAPFLIFLGWYSLAGIAGPMPSAALEIVTAFAIVLATGAGIALVEGALQGIEWKGAAFVAVLAMLALALFLFVRFANSVPWTDLWQEPPVMY